MRRLRRVKILVTLGPASQDRDMIGRLFEAGADVFRINMSHSDHDGMRERIREMRQQFVEKLRTKVPNRDYSFVMRQRGMFSYSGLTKDQVTRLREEFSVYAIDTGRICVAALNTKNINYVVDAVAKVIA